MRPKCNEGEGGVEVDSTDRDSSSGDGVSRMSGGFSKFVGRGGEGALRWRGRTAPPSTEDSN